MIIAGNDRACKQCADYTRKRVMLLTDIPYEQYDAIVMLINQASASIETEMRRRLREAVIFGAR